MGNPGPQPDSELRGVLHDLFDQGRLFEIDGEDWAVGVFEADDRLRARRMITLLRRSHGHDQHGDLTVHIFGREGSVQQSHHFSFILNGELVVGHAYRQLLHEHQQLALGTEFTDKPADPAQAIIGHISQLSAEHVVQPIDPDLAL